METSGISILEVILSIALLVTWLVAVAQIIAIRRTVSRRYSHIDAEHEAEICRIAGDEAGYLKNMYRALYYYWVGSPHHRSESNHELLKQEMRERYYNVIVKAGGTYPAKFIPTPVNKFV
ncbi:MAG TPA: hypothetical protein PLA77_08300 [Bacteroidales bacterium]|nr:hypothetical protein [Bacteroidales bacterium]